MRKFAISDIHGCADTFCALLDSVAFSTEDELYLLGDYIDRGPRSKQVIDEIIHLQSKDYHIICLAGNHDVAMLDARFDHSFLKTWRETWGGKQTMESFGISYLDDIPEQYWSFLKNLDFYMEVDKYILVHAGLDFFAKDPLKPDVNMLFVRNWYQRIDYDWLGDRIIVHGHTPIVDFEIQAMMMQLDQDQVIDIDAGCFIQNREGNGKLCAFDLTNRELYFQQRLDDVSGYWSPTL